MDTETRIERILTERDENERMLIGALQDMLDTALATDDGAWGAGIERAETDRPCDRAAKALAYVMGCGFEDIAAQSRVRRAGRLQARTTETARRIHRATEVA